MNILRQALSAGLRGAAVDPAWASGNTSANAPTNERVEFDQQEIRRAENGERQVEAATQ